MPEGPDNAVFEKLPYAFTMNRPRLHSHNMNHLAVVLSRRRSKHANELHVLRATYLQTKNSASQRKQTIHIFDMLICSGNVIKTSSVGYSADRLRPLFFSIWCQQLWTRQIKRLLKSIHQWLD